MKWIKAENNDLTLGLYTIEDNDLDLSELFNKDDFKKSSGGAMGYPHKYVEFDSDIFDKVVNKVYEEGYDLFQSSSWGNDFLIVYSNDLDKVQDLYKNFFDETDEFGLSFFEDYLFKYSPVEPVGFIIQN